MSGLVSRFLPRFCYFQYREVRLYARKLGGRGGGRRDGNEAKFARVLTSSVRVWKLKTGLFVIVPDNLIGDWCSYVCGDG